jgi:hypothetical protein
MTGKAGGRVPTGLATMSSDQVRNDVDKVSLGARHRDRPLEVDEDHAHASKSRWQRLSVRPGFRISDPAFGICFFTWTIGGVLGGTISPWVWGPRVYAGVFVCTAPIVCTFGGLLFAGMAQWIMNWQTARSNAVLVRVMLAVVAFCVSAVLGGWAVLICN